MGGQAHQLLSLQHALQKVHFAGVLTDRFRGRFTERQQDKVNLLLWQRGRRRLGPPHSPCLDFQGLQHVFQGTHILGRKVQRQPGQYPRQEQTRERGGTGRGGAREGRGHRRRRRIERAWPVREAVGRETRTSGVYARGACRRRPEGAETVACGLDHPPLGLQDSAAAWDSLTFSRRHSSGSRFSAAIDSQRQSSRTRFNSSRDVASGR